MKRNRDAIMTLTIATTSILEYNDDHNGLSQLQERKKKKKGAKEEIVRTDGWMSVGSSWNKGASRAIVRLIFWRVWRMNRQIQ